MTTFAFDMPRSAAALASFAASSSSVPVFPSHDVAQGLFGALLSAELLAADAGVVPYIDVPDGAGGSVRGVASVGAARELIDTPSRWTGVPSVVASQADVAGVQAAIRALYLGAHGAARQTTASARQVDDGAASGPSVGLIPVAVYLVAIGVAAIVATAAYAIATENARTAVNGENVRQAARVVAAITLAQAQLASTGTIGRDAWEFLGAEAAQEAAVKSPSLALATSPVVLAGGALLLGGAGVASYLAWQQHQREGQRGLLRR